jgi:aldose sugar dehydrogenase
MISTVIFFNIETYAEPQLFDKSYSIKKIVEGLNFPTSMTVIEDEILVTEMSSGKIFKVTSNTINSVPLIEIPVAEPPCECGLLGITSVNNEIFVFYTESSENNELTNIVAKYRYNGISLTEPEIIKKMPIFEKYMLGGTMTTGLNDEVYFTTGDQGSLNEFSNFVINEKREIIKVGPKEYNSPGNTDIGSIFKISNGEIEHYAMGLRNSFGLAIDPITGFLWATDNGPEIYDEINLIERKSNGGWAILSGPTERNDGYTSISEELDLKIHYKDYKYIEPKFSFYVPIGITSIEFPHGQSFEKYKNHVFVGDFNTGKIYKFQLNSNRDGFNFHENNLKDLVYDEGDKNDEIIFVKGIPGGISDIVFKNDGMYVLSIFEGSIYKISSNQTLQTVEEFEMGADLSGSDLSFVDLSGKDLTGVDLTNADLSGSDLSFVDLSGKDLTGVKLTGADLSGSDLSFVDLSGKDLTGVDLTNADLSNTDLTNAKLSQAKITGKYVYADELSLIDFASYRIQNMILSGFGMLGMELNGKELIFGIVFTFTDLAGPIYQEINDSIDEKLEDTILIGADLSGSDLSFVDLSRKDLTGVKLTGADLSNTDLTNCKNHIICQ